MSALRYANQLIKLDLNCSRVSILGVLNQKDHQERDDGSAGINYKLPSVAELKDWARDNPGNDYRHCQCEGPRAAAEVRGRFGES